MKYKRGQNDLFTHKGILAGFVPVYTDDIGSVMEARWWWAEYLLDVVDWMVRYMGAEPKLKLTGEI